MRGNNPFVAPDSQPRPRTKTLPLCIVKTSLSTSFAIATVLTLLHSWYSCHLYVPIRHPCYLSIDNRSAFWAVRVGDLGGVHGFSAGLDVTEPAKLEFIRRHKPSPVAWIIDWCFRISSRGPYFLLVVPLHLPVVTLGVWSACLIRRVVRRRNDAKSSGAGRSARADHSTEGETEGEQVAEPELPITGS